MQANRKQGVIGWFLGSTFRAYIYCVRLGGWLCCTFTHAT